MKTYASINKRITKCNKLIQYLTVLRCAALMAVTIAMQMNASLAIAESGDTPTKLKGMYAGVFVGTGQVDNRIVDVKGFANWGQPGWAVDYNRSADVGGLLVGRKFNTSDKIFFLESDLIFGNMTASTKKLEPYEEQEYDRADPPVHGWIDPYVKDESAETNYNWILLLRGGAGKVVGKWTIFVTGGMAVAQITDSLTDIDFDFRPDTYMPLEFDPDDSFSTKSEKLGWVLGIGVESQFTKSWTARLETLYFDFGKSTHYANHFKDDRCEPGNEMSLCPYGITHKLKLVRFAITRPF